MNVVTVERRLWTPETRKQHAPELLGEDEPTMLVDAETGQVIAVQYILDRPEMEDERKELTRWLRFKLQWHDDGVTEANKASSARLSGIQYPSRVFGYTAPSPLRRRWGASLASINQQNPTVAALLDLFTERNWQTFTEQAEQQADAHLRLTLEKVKRDWLMAGKPFTSGIINNTAALPYHKDSGNLNGSWSAMLALRNGVRGGGLHLPEYDVTFGIPPGSITFFDGNNAWHGVTPFELKSSEGYRFTLVWYAKRGFVGCGTAEEEIALAQQRATRK